MDALSFVLARNVHVGDVVVDPDSRLLGQVATVIVSPETVIVHALTAEVGWRCWTFEPGLALVLEHRPY